MATMIYFQSTKKTLSMHVANYHTTSNLAGLTQQPNDFQHTNTKVHTKPLNTGHALIHTIGKSLVTLARRHGTIAACHAYACHATYVYENPQAKHCLGMVVALHQLAMNSNKQTNPQNSKRANQPIGIYA